MFSLQQYNITLKLVESDDLEEIRLGRNKHHVRSQLVHDHVVSSEMQQEWFKNISTPKHYVFVIIYRNKKVGLLSVKDFFNGLQGDCTASIFIWEEQYLNTRLPLLSIWMAVDFFYMRLGTSSMKTLVKRNNSRALKLDAYIGFEILDEGDPVYVSVTSEQSAYQKKRAEIISICQRLCKDVNAHDLKIKGEPSERLAREINELLKHDK